MNSPMPSSRGSSVERYIGARRIPPWEAVNLPQIPHTTSSIPQPLPTDQRAHVLRQKPERDKLKCLCTCHCNEMSNTSPPVADIKFEGRVWTSRENSFPENSSNSPSVQYRDIPDVAVYERPHESTSSQRTSSVVALPGTMSSRSAPVRPPVVPSNKSSYEQGCKRDTQVSGNDSPTLGRRLSSAVKELFRKDNIEDSQLERVDDRHWSED